MNLVLFNKAGLELTEGEGNSVEILGLEQGQRVYKGDYKVGFRQHGKTSGLVDVPSFTVAIYEPPKVENFELEPKLEKLTKAELQELLEQNEIDYPSKATKDELKKLIKAAE